MAETKVKGPVLSDLLKHEQPNFLGREKALVTSAAALKVGTVLQGGPAAAVPWDLSDVEDIYGILLTDVPAGAAALPVSVLFAGPAAVNPEYLIWDASAVPGDITDGLERLKKFNFVFEREAATDKLHPNQIDRVGS